MLENSFQTAKNSSIEPFDVEGFIAQEFFRGLEPDSYMSVSDWADAYRTLSSKSAAEPGRWRTISNLERGTVLPSLELVYKLSNQLNISIDELLSNKIQTNKSLARLKKESEVIEEIMLVNDKLLEHLHKYLKLIKNNDAIF